MVKAEHNEEIDILGIILTIWGNKFKIAAITFISFCLTFIYLTNEEPRYKTVTEIRPISNLEEFKYLNYNEYVDKTMFSEDQTENEDKESVSLSKSSLENWSADEKPFEFKNINKSNLILIFKDKLNNNSLFVEEMKKLNYIKRDNYQNNEDYELALEKLASSIKIVPPAKNLIYATDLPYWSIQFITDDRLKWESLLEEVNKSANKEIQKDLKNAFKDSVFFKNQLINFELEDLEITISNILKNYNQQVANRLVYLKEQSQIARKLNISKDEFTNKFLSLEENTFHEFIKNSQEPGIIESPFYYMRGYEVIEKEIEILINRKDNRSFVKGLNDLIVKKDNLLADNSLERMKDLFEKTPIVNSDNFQAAKIMYHSTEFENTKGSKVLFLTVSILVGLFFGIFYVLVQSALKKRG